MKKNCKMKKEKLLKILTSIIIGILLVTMSVNAFAATTDKSFLDITNQVDQSEQQDALSGVQDGNGSNNASGEEESSGNNYGTDIPKAGIAENTVMVVAVLALSVVAVVAYNRMKYYKNI